MGEGRTIKAWFFGSCIPNPPAFYLLFRPWITTFLSSFRANSLVPVDTLLTFNYLPISLLRHLGTQSQRKRGNDRSDFFRPYRGIMGLWVPFAGSLSGCIYRGRWESMEWEGDLFQHHLGVCQRIFLLYCHLEICCNLEETNLTRKLKVLWPKD